MDTSTFPELLDAIHGAEPGLHLTVGQRALLVALLPALTWVDEEPGMDEIGIGRLDYLEFLAADNNLLPEPVWWFIDGPGRLRLVSVLPTCDICAAGIAHYDAAVRRLDGRWAHLCQACWTAHCPPALGAGIAQRLETYDTVPASVTRLCAAAEAPPSRRPRAARLRGPQDG